MHRTNLKRSYEHIWSHLAASWEQHYLYMTSAVNTVWARAILLLTSSMPGEPPCSLLRHTGYWGSQANTVGTCSSSSSYFSLQCVLQSAVLLPWQLTLKVEQTCAHRCLFSSAQGQLHGRTGTAALTHTLQLSRKVNRVSKLHLESLRSNNFRSLYEQLLQNKVICKDSRDTYADVRHKSLNLNPVGI